MYRSKIARSFLVAAAVSMATASVAQASESHDSELQAAVRQAALISMSDLRSSESVLLAAAGRVEALESRGSSEDYSLHGSGGPSRHEIYAKAGVLGAGLGYAYGVNESLTLRVDFTTIGKISRDFNANDLDYKGDVRNDMATLYADWFPFQNGFRLTGGVGFRDTSIKARLDSDSSGNVKIDNYSVTVDGEDSIKAEVDYPSVAPYLGFGYGHNVAQHSKAGWGFIADVGVYFGKPSVKYHASDSLMAKLNAASMGQAQAAIDREKDEIRDKIGKYKIFPALYVGVSYRF